MAYITGQGYCPSCDEITSAVKQTALKPGLSCLTVTGQVAHKHLSLLTSRVIKCQQNGSDALQLRK